MSAATFRWSDASVRRALGLPGGDPARLYRSVSTDTRTLGRGDIFVALKGDRFDGHAFVPKAVAAGVRGGGFAPRPGRLRSPRLPGPRHPHGAGRPGAAPA